MEALSFGDHNFASGKPEDYSKAKNKLTVRIDDYPADLCPFSDSDDDISSDIQNGHTAENAVQARLSPVAGSESDDIRREFGSQQTGNNYPAGLCPFSDTEDDLNEKEEISVQKIVKENNYPAGLCPFSDTEDNPCEEEISVEKILKESKDYPEHLNPFADDTVNIQKKKPSFGKKRRAPQPPASHWDPDGYMVLFCRGQEE